MKPKGGPVDLPHHDSRMARKSLEVKHRRAMSETRFTQRQGDRRVSAPTLSRVNPLLGMLLCCHCLAGVTLADSTGLFSYLGADPNELGFMKDGGLYLGGWIDVGITANFNRSPGGYNGPVTLGDRAGYPQMNQLYLYVERTIHREDAGWDLGGRFDFIYGTDALYAQAYGAPEGNWDMNLMPNDPSRFYNLALPQAYLELRTPIGNGLMTKLGHFYTVIGYETFMAPNNFFYSHAYTMQYGEPFTHTGLLMDYPLDYNWSLSGGIVTGSVFGGWDGGFNQGLGNWNGIGGMTWISDDKGTTLTINFTTGPTSEQNSSNLSLYSIVLRHDLIENLHFILQHDWGSAANADIDLTSRKLRDAQWYGLNSYLIFDIRDDLGIGLRGEWFRDQHGFRVFSPGRTLGLIDPIIEPLTQEFTGLSQPASYYALTLGLNWRPKQWITVRPNLRYDWSDSTNAFNNGPSALSWKGNRKDQLLFSTDIVISF